MKQEMWAWYDKKENKYKFIYPIKEAVQMCSPDHFEREIKCGEGEIVKVIVYKIE